MDGRDWWRQWRSLLQPGDFLSIALAAGAVVWLGLSLWGPQRPQRAVVRVAGAVHATLPLDRPGSAEVRGPLGLTRIEVQPGRARVAADPGPRQYCVLQGWLTRAGAAAICAPNQVTLTLEGAPAPFDSLSY